VHAVPSPKLDQAHKGALCSINQLQMTFLFDKDFTQNVTLHCTQPLASKCNAGTSGTHGPELVFCGLCQELQASDKTLIFPLPYSFNLSLQIHKRTSVKFGYYNPKEF